MDDANHPSSQIEAVDNTHSGFLDARREQLLAHEQSARIALERQKDEFLASVSHDLRTPLTAIKASIGVVLANEPPGTPEPLHRMFVNIELAADRMTQLVVNLLELTRLQAGRVELRRVCCDVAELARRSARTLEPRAHTRGQQLKLDLPTEPLYLRVDPDRLERALVNLLDNAHKYGPDGGTIGLRLESRPTEALLAVSDDGPGIAEPDRERIFERFYRSEAETVHRNHGSGLGLPIARAMVELHGGRIWVESALGRGSTFFVALPARSATSAAPSS